MKVTLQEIRERTYKPVDAWWTVLLVDPLASRLVRQVAPYRWITPNVLTLIATILGTGAAVSFAIGDRWWLVAGGILFHLSFVVDCMDGKIARLNGTGTIFGQWLDFVLDRVRVFFIALALFGGQYAKTGNDTYLWVMAIAIFLDLFRYLNSAQMQKVRKVMRDQLDALKPPVTTQPTPAAEMGEPADEMPEEDTASQPRPTTGKPSLKRRIGSFLRARRIRTHLISGIEYEMTVFIIAPVTGFIIPVTILAGAGLLAFELFLIYKLLKACRAYPAKLAAAEEKWAAYQAEQDDQAGHTDSAGRVPTTV
ncbi:MULTISPECIES: CDP-alcohol phosphatidyltransferase family protein [Actinoplanes]|uniref:CDP-alcohol phosphatidyltransferase family protein n=1 Tax=Actinoplanes TaxID=1865 RepID=UPI0007C870BA|nr:MULTISPECIES: CDP-alcohol phosphatidyltransferase family protein [Actinoplanes]